MIEMNSVDGLCIPTIEDVIGNASEIVIGTETGTGTETAGIIIISTIAIGPRTEVVKPTVPKVALRNFEANANMDTNVKPPTMGMRKAVLKSFDRPIGRKPVEPRRKVTAAVMVMVDLIAMVDATAIEIEIGIGIWTMEVERGGVMIVAVGWTGIENGKENETETETDGIMIHADAITVKYHTDEEAVTFIITTIISTRNIVTIIPIGIGIEIATVIVIVIMKFQLILILLTMNSDAHMTITAANRTATTETETGGEDKGIFRDKGQLKDKDKDEDFKINHREQTCLQHT